MFQLPEFKTAKERLDYVLANRAFLLQAKRAQTKHGDAFGITATGTAVVKAVTGNTAADTAEVINRTIIGNTYYWMDSHLDVHVPGCFAKSASELAGKFHIHDHLFQVMARVGIPKSLYEGPISWSDLGVNKAGNTEALFMNSDIKKELNDPIFNAYRNGEITQHSVGMQYIRCAFAVNDPSEKEAYILWRQVYPLLGNPERADEYGFFCVVQEAKLLEISCVLAGSNSLTPTLPPGNSTLPAPDKSTQEAPRKSMLAALGQQLQTKN